MGLYMGEKKIKICHKHAFFILKWDSEGRVLCAPGQSALKHVMLPFRNTTASQDSFITKIEPAYIKLTSLLKQNFQKQGQKGKFNIKYSSTYCFAI